MINDTAVAQRRERWRFWNYGTLHFHLLLITVPLVLISHTDEGNLISLVNNKSYFTLHTNDGGRLCDVSKTGQVQDVGNSFRRF